MTRYWRIATASGPRWARGHAVRHGLEVLDENLTLTELLADLNSSFDVWETAPATHRIDADEASPLAPIEDQPVWAAGVTFERSRKARREESQSGGNFYDHVYDAERPELFYKSAGADVVGPGGTIGIRIDSNWDVPEPELALVLNAAGNVLAFTLGNDVSSRSIEGDNPLYLPQAKVYTGSCALGPCLVPLKDVPSWRDLTVRLTIERDGQTAYQDTVHLATMRRDPADLASWLFRCQRFPHGAVLLTGTSIVPDPDVTLASGDVVTISADDIGELKNVSTVVS